MAEIFLVRHGETQWNAQGRYQGHLDSPLTTTGIGQATTIGDRFKELGIWPALFVASPLGRTRQTAAIIAERSALPPLVFDSRLAEVSTGSWDGLTQFEIDMEWPGMLQGTTAFDWYFRSPDGESYAAALERVFDWLNDVDGCVVAVTHGLIGRIIRGAYLGLPMEEALGLPVPQDVIWRIADGKVEAIPAGRPA
ncbi:MAG: histidine phosphatase family protein [Tsuneonella sp.]